MKYHKSPYITDQFKNLNYSRATPERRYVKLLKWYHDNGPSDRFTAVSEVFNDTDAVKRAWLSDHPRNELRGYAITYFGQLVNDGLLDAEKNGRNTIFSLTTKGEDLLRRCGAL